MAYFIECVLSITAQRTSTTVSTQYSSGAGAQPTQPRSNTTSTAISWNPLININSSRAPASESPTITASVPATNVTNRTPNSTYGASTKASPSVGKI